MNLPLQRLSDSGSISLDQSDLLLSPHPLFIILVAQSLSPQDCGLNTNSWMTGHWIWNNGEWKTTVKNWDIVHQILSATNHTWTCPRLNSATNTIRMTASSVSSPFSVQIFPHSYTFSSSVYVFRITLYSATHNHFSNGCVITQMMTIHKSLTGPNSKEPQVPGQDHRQIMTNFALSFAVQIGLHNVDYKRRVLNPGVLSGRWNRVRLPSVRT